MCLIIFTPNIARAKLRKAVLERGFKRNSDGAGLAFIEDGIVRLSKPFFNFEDFHLAYQRIRSRINKGPLLIHFRWATCGSNTAVNTQPLVIYRGRLVMAHNGMFPALSNLGEDISDSVYLTRMIRNAGWNFPFKKNENEMLTALCDNYSKLVFLDNQGRYTIINEELGSWREGSWYSDKARCYQSDAIKSSSKTSYSSQYTNQQNGPVCNVQCAPLHKHFQIKAAPPIPRHRSVQEEIADYHKLSEKQKKLSKENWREFILDQIYNVDGTCRRLTNEELSRLPVWCREIYKKNQLKSDVLQPVTMSDDDFGMIHGFR
jgi:predicted glutamine amidotransferase